MQHQIQATIASAPGGPADGAPQVFRAQFEEKLGGVFRKFAFEDAGEFGKGRRGNDDVNVPEAGEVASPEQVCAPAEESAKERVDASKLAKRSSEVFTGGPVSAVPRDGDRVPESRFSQTIPVEDRGPICRFDQYASPKISYWLPQLRLSRENFACRLGFIG